MESLGERIAHDLVSSGALTAERLEEAVALQGERGTQLQRILVNEKFVTNEELTVSLGRCLETAPLRLSRIQLDAGVVEIVPRDIARQYKVVPYARVDNVLFVAMVDPLNVVALDDLRQATGMEIVPVISCEDEVTGALDGYGGVRTDMEELLRDADVPDIQVTGESLEKVDLDELIDSSEEGPVIKVVNLVMLQAIKDRASDIHIEAQERAVRLRYRIDGVLYDYTPPPKNLQAAISSRIKIMANMDIAERRLPQDGRFRIRMQGRDIDLRVSVLPTVHGEKVVMRVLDKGALSTRLDDLGMPEDSLRQFRWAIGQPHGMILVTGPTGSGKTTTLYSALQELNSDTVNIVTTEDPVEYQLEGINQVQVHTDIGLSFASSLRSILRQDPDIVMVGEIRDHETADIAVKAALTGHLVLSTLHTNDAAGAMARLADMGIEPFLIASSLTMACAQRLVRRICPHCREDFTVPAEMTERLGMAEDIRSKPFFRGGGCDRCKRTGYMGRAALIEVLLVNRPIRDAIVREANASEIKAIGLQHGMKTLRMAGLEKAVAGQTSLEEVLRVTAGDH